MLAGGKTAAAAADQKSKLLDCSYGENAVGNESDQSRPSNNYNARGWARQSMDGQKQLTIPLLVIYAGSLATLAGKAKESPVAIWCCKTRVCTAKQHVVHAHSDTRGCTRMKAAGSKQPGTVARTKYVG
jgi:hypothetical protein